VHSVYIFLLQIIALYSTFGLIEIINTTIMKKLLIAFCLILFLVPATKAQFTKIGAASGYNYNWHFNNEQSPDHMLTKFPFLSFNTVYEINLPFHLVPRLNIYIPRVEKTDEIDFQFKTTTWGIALDLDGHYVFNSLDKMELYGLAGLNILVAGRKYVEEFAGSDDFVDKSTSTNLGLNLGAGAYWKVKDEFDLFFELKAIVASQIQVVGTFGILLNMEYLWNKETDSGY